jgi:EmrB/QacA subfamily drug resistance transporter
MGNTLPMKPFGRALPLTIATAFFMEQLDSSVINTALPAIAHDLGTSIPQLAFSITAYLISLAVFMPLGGWLADRYGGRRVFMSALAIFAAGSLLCGLAPNNFSLIVGRIVQGMGGAMMAPVGRAILMSSVSKSEYVRAMNYVIMPALIGPAVGPLVGGFLATYISWHWIFLINLPLAAIGIGMSLRFMPAKVAEGDGKPKPLDWIGYGFLIVALGTGQFAIEIFGHAAHRLGALEVGLLSASATALFLWRYRRIGSGILDLGLLRIRTFRLSITAGSIARAGIGGIPFLLPLLLQVGFGYHEFHIEMVGMPPNNPSKFLHNGAGPPWLSDVSTRHQFVVHVAVRVSIRAAPFLSDVYHQCADLRGYRKMRHVASVNHRHPRSAAVDRDWRQCRSFGVEYLEPGTHA